MCSAGGEVIKRYHQNLKDTDILEIKHQLKHKNTREELAESFGVPVQEIINIQEGRIGGHLRLAPIRPTGRKRPKKKLT